MDIPLSFPLSHEEWILDETQKSDWESFLASQGLAYQTVENILSQHQLVTISFGNPSPIPPESPISADSSEIPSLLWENEEIEVFAPSHPRVRHHLWVALKRPTSFSEVTSEEAIQLKSTVNKIVTTLQETLGLRAVIAQWNEPQPGQLSKRYTIEVIPARMDSAQANNFWDKVECNNYVIFRGRFPPSIPAPSDAEKSEDYAFWKEILQNGQKIPFCTKRTADPIRDWLIKRSHFTSGAAKILECVEHILHKEGFRFQRAPTPQKIPDQQTRDVARGCAFCNSSVIAKQTVYETELSRLFYNFKPATPGAHFLIVPKRHLRTTELLREDEVKDIHQLAQKLAKVLEEKTGRTDITMYTQDGPAVGQTVGHTHMHMMLTPQVLRQLFFSLNYEFEKPVSAEEMQSVVQEISQRLKHAF